MNNVTYFVQASVNPREQEVVHDRFHCDSYPGHKEVIS